jgi:hypothetical protein
MRKFIVLLSVFAILGSFVPAAFAQAPAAAPPAPKVTINGLFDLLITKYHNWSGLTENDITQTRDSGFYSRQRFVPTITGEVGRTKGVLSLEFDLMNGCTGGANCGPTGVTFAGHGAGLADAVHPGQHADPSGRAARARSRVQDRHPVRR